MRKKLNKMQFVMILMLMIVMFTPAFAAETEAPVVRLKGKPKAEEPNFADFGNMIAIGTGQVKDGSQIPLPYYQDGKQAKRSEAQYIVSPAEVPTSMTYVTGQLVDSQGNASGGASGTFFIKCKADKDGLVHISLWQQSGTGEGTEVVSANSYRLIKENFTREGIRSANSDEEDENVVTAQMRVLSEKLIANYMVIAIRSPKK